MSSWGSLLLLTGLLCFLADGKPLKEESNIQEVYQAEEHSTITLPLFLPVNMTSEWLYVELRSVESRTIIYKYHSRYKSDTFIADKFQDRLHCDPRRVENRPTECLLKDVTISDAGTYQWIIKPEGGTNPKKWELKVTAPQQFANVSQLLTLKTQEDNPKVELRHRIVMCVVFGLFATVVLCLFCKIITSNTKNVPSSSYFHKISDLSIAPFIALCKARVTLCN